jgi:lysophospholipase L1-like esterase
MALETINNGETNGSIRGKINANFTSVNTASTNAEAKATEAKAAALAATPVIQIETAEYLGRLKAGGFSIDANHINANDALVVKAKSKENWWSSVVEIGTLCGTSLGAASIKLKKAAGAPEITWHNLTEDDYSPSVGVDPGSSSNKYGDLGFQLTNVGLAYNNLSLAVGLPFANKNQIPGFGAVISNIPDTIATGDANANIGFNGATPLMGQALTFDKNERVTVVNSSPQGLSHYSCGVEMMNERTPVTSKDISGNMCILKGKNSGGEFPYFNSLGIYVVGASLTVAQRKQMSIDLLEFMLETKRLPNNKPTIVFFGDSISQGGTHSGTKGGFQEISQKLGYFDINIGRGSTKFNLIDTTATLQTLPSGYGRYPDLFKLSPDIIHIMYGTNDIGGDNNAGGVADPGILTSMTNNLTGMVQDMKRKGIKIIVSSPPWRSTNTSKVEAYVKAQSDVCVANLIPFVDMYNLFLDTGNPSSFFPDGLHLNVAGYRLMIDHLMKMILSNSIYRTPTLDFTSIAAGSSGTQTLTMYTARAGQEVVVTPRVPTPGIQYMGYVTADDIVTVKLTNTTGAAIDPAAQEIRVTVTA